MKSADVVVIGAGVIGLGIAWRCTQRGLRVTVLDPSPGSGASHTAAGMLAPVTELHYGEEPLLRLGLDSAARYPAFAAELEAVAGAEVGYRRCGTLSIAWDGADFGALRDLHALQQSLGLPAELVTGRELRRLEPSLAPGLPGGLSSPDDHQIDNRLLHKALLSIVGDVIEQPVVALTRAAGRISGVQLADGSSIEAGSVVLAAGAWSSRLDGAPPGVRPVKGQTLRLRTSEPLLRRVVRGSVKGSAVYLVPRADGTVVVGASSEEAGFDIRPRAGAVYELLRDAQSLVPATSEAELLEVSTGLRPGSPDNAPLIGVTPEGLIYACGHYRNGILLAPVTADGVSELIASGELPPILRPFGAGRFERVPA
ncbi:MAG TPA: glycine oxidase ThiO [Jatrophihabitantaceae bacterium]|jgi:glycine oxidase|nr:glycine oxidase ThiO [Jatrophihabitantaceae bacterium]